MIEYGRSLRWYNNLHSEIDFCKQHGFDFLQVWFKNGEILVDNLHEPKDEHILATGFPFIIHALFDINDFEKYENKLLEVLKKLKCNEVILHPVCQSEAIVNESIHILSKKINCLSKLLKNSNIKLFVENNSKIDPINYTIEDIKILFNYNPEVELLLDIAHIDNYEHLKSIIKIKTPKCLHLADKHFSVDHEHLPIGHGSLDFEMIFSDILKDFDGKIIFEVVTDDDYAILDGLTKIKQIIGHQRN